MLFSHMNDEELKKAKDDLKQRLSTTLNPTRITNLTNEGCFVEGGIFPGRFIVWPDDGEAEPVLYVWGRSSRQSGIPLSVDTLVRAERTIKAFFAEHGVI